MTHICVSKLTIIVSDNGLSPGRHQAIIWINDGILLIGPLRTNFSEILIEIYTFSFTKIDWKMLSGKCRPFCLSLNVLMCLHCDGIWHMIMHVACSFNSLAPGRCGCYIYIYIYILYIYTCSNNQTCIKDRCLQHFPWTALSWLPQYFAED